MKKTKIISLILALVMMLSLGITAFAASEPTNEPATQNVTIKLKTKAGRQYYFYRVLNAEIVDGKNGKVVYEINQNFRDFFMGDNAPGKKGGFVTTSPADNTTPAIYYNTNRPPSVYYLNVTNDNVKSFADALKKFATEKTVTHVRSIKTAGEQITSVDVLPGYYLITSDEGAAVMTTTNYDSDRPVILDKNKPPKVTKKVAILDGADNPVDEYEDYVYVEYGEKVRFRIEVEIGNVGAENYVIYDEFDNFVFDSSKGKVTDPGEFEYKKYELYYVTAEDETINGEIIPAGTEIKMVAGQQHRVDTVKETVEGEEVFKAYKWTILDDDLYSKASKFVLYLDMVPQGFVPAKGYKNTTYVTYGSGNHETLKDDAWVYGAGIRVIKKAESDSKDAERLNGAKFVVMDSSQKKYAKFDVPSNGTTGTLTWVTNQDDATVYVTDTYEDLTLNVSEKGKVEILGLRYGLTYFLKEIEAPANYSLLTAPQEVVLKVGQYESMEGYEHEGNEGFVRPTTVVNEIQAGKLPETGGMGTALFYTLGGLMVATVLFALITNKRVRY